MASEKDTGFPQGTSDERELLLRWLAFLRSAVRSKLGGLGEEDARWRPLGALISLLGIVNHLTNVEWRWIDGAMLGRDVSRHEEEFHPGPELSVEMALERYESRARATDGYARSVASITEPAEGRGAIDLRFVLLHLINETARHAGHADATRELLDGRTGE